MVNRIADQFSCIPEECFEHLAKTLERKDNKKLFSVVNSEERANDIKKQLIASGYNVSIKKNHNMFEVLYSSEQSRIKVTANVLNSFTPVGNNLYKSMQKVAGIYDYDFDDGSIWRIEKFDDGEYLVKEINNNDENDVVRTKTAASASYQMDNDVFTKIAKMFYGSIDSVIDDAIQDKTLKQAMEKVLNTKLSNTIQSLLQKHNVVTSSKYINDLHLKTLIEKSITSKIDLENLIVSELQLKQKRGV